MKKLIIIITLLTLIGCQATVRPPTRVDGGRYSLLDVRLGMTESQIIEMFGDIPFRSATGIDSRVVRVSGNKKLFCYSSGRPGHTTAFRFENGELVEFFQLTYQRRMCDSPTAID